MFKLLNVALKSPVLFILGVLFLLLPLSRVQALPPPRSYQYDSIIATIKVNQDSTFDVEETQVFNYIGNYHKGFRSIPFNKIDTISDISVTDGRTNQELIYSSSKLQKEDPNSWGKFTYYRQNGAQIIEWYYDLSDTIYAWIIKYRVHGGIEFNRGYDRLYWNIFSGYEVPVASARATIVLPGDFSVESIPAYSYRTAAKPVEQRISSLDRSVSFTSSDFAANEAFTVDVSWPKGSVSQAAYWLDFVRIYWGYIFSAVIFLVCLIAGFLFWLFSERLKQGKGTIIPQYKPPENLRPAIAEVITKEKITNKGLAATIIDLAVRGIVKIEEEPNNEFWEKVSSIVGVSLIFGSALFMFLVIFEMFTSGDPAASFRDVMGILLVVGVMGLGGFLFLKKGWNVFRQHADYKVTRLESLEGREVGREIEEYEARYLDILMRGKDYFQTKSLRHSTSQQLYHSIQKLKDDIYEQASVKTKAYDVDLIQEKKKSLIWKWLFYAIIAIIAANLYFKVGFGQTFLLAAVSAISIIGLYAFIKYEARLNESGRILREEWLGFKMYLEKAEKYRLQNLTPDLFEKYLPYAMIFGIEKKWAKAFEGIDMPAPSWYSGGGYHGSSGNSFSSSRGSSFSPSGFSASFASSFSSSFGSSGAGSGGG